MLKLGIKSVVNFVLYSNLWIALAASAQVLLTFSVAEHNSMYRLDYTLAILFGTWAFYALLRFIKLADGSFQLTDSERIAELFKRKWHLAAWILIAGVLALLFAKNLPLSFQIGLCICTLLALTYGWNLGFHPLRRWPYLKSFLVPLVWVIITVLLPTYLTPSKFEDALLWHALERFCFIFAITLPFDLRDVEADTRQGIRTIPSKLGSQKTQILAVTIAVLGFFIGEIHWVRCLIYGIAIGLIYYTRHPRHDYWYSAALDGLLILQPCLLFLLQSTTE
jgi:hypothetical protein